MPQEPPVQPIEYGHGKPSRRTSRLAIAGFVLVLPLWAMVAWNILAWRAQPPPASGFAGLGWFIGMIGLFSLLVVSTLLLGPLSFALGVAGLWAVRSHPYALRGRWLARLGIALSLGVCLLVGAAHYRVRRYMAAAQRASAAAAASLPPSQYPAYEEVREMEQLVRDCQMYAHQNDDRFPDDIQSLHKLYLDRYAYFGSGLTFDEFEPARQDENQRMVVIVRRRPLPGTRWVVGFNGSPFRATALVVPDGELDRLFDETNRIRVQRGLAPIDFNTVLGRTPTPPATRPTAAPQP